MRNLLTGALASLSLAILLVGSASAGGMYTSSAQRPLTSNSSLQAQLERDAHSPSALRQSPAGQIVALGDTTPAASRLHQSANLEGSTPWLYRSPRGQVIGQPSPSSEQSAESHAAQEE